MWNESRCTGEGTQLGQLYPSPKFPFQSNQNQEWLLVASNPLIGVHLPRRRCSHISSPCSGSQRGQLTREGEPGISTLPGSGAWWGAGGWGWREGQTSRPGHCRLAAGKDSLQQRASQEGRRS